MKLCCLLLLCADHKVKRNKINFNDSFQVLIGFLCLFVCLGTEFLKPVILNIPHYANTLPSLGISLKATDSEQDICTDWDNILLPSNHAANSVAVKVDHF